MKKADQDLDSVKAQIKLKEHKTQIQKEKIRQAQNILDQPREEIQREHNAKLKEKVNPIVLVHGTYIDNSACPRDQRPRAAIDSQ